jgi:methylenetetrahydrofolate dehydrogenase (NADP+)/methenyltetrahydrofolate cyclohydrolase/formyltetrahydrofolate synthetase
MKAKAAAEAGITFQHVVLDDDADIEAVLAAVEKLNGDDSIHGLLVQLPLSDKIGRQGEQLVTEAVSAEKDVDGQVSLLLQNSITSVN